jgi:transcriptional regulator with XRE-family HTH domain
MATAARHARAPRKSPVALVPRSVIDVRSLRQQHGLSQSLMARLLDVSLRTVSGLESGSVAPEQFRRNINQVKRLCGALAEAMEAGFVGRWLDEPNEMLGGLKPVEAIERGQIDLIWQIVEGLRSGSQL